MILPDVNILLYAFRQDVIQHDESLAWLEEVVNGREPYAIAPQTLASMIRITTNPKAFAQASTLREALDYCAALIEREHCVIVRPGPAHWRLFSELCQEVDATGNLVSDAWFAALAIEAGCEWITTDRNYARFAGLRWRTPF